MGYDGWNGLIAKGFALKSMELYIATADNIFFLNLLCPYFNANLLILFDVQDFVYVPFKTGRQASSTMCASTACLHLAQQVLFNR